MSGSRAGCSGPPVPASLWATSSGGSAAGSPPARWKRWSTAISATAPEARLQDTITGPARATALSVAGFGAEVFAVPLYAVFVLPVALPVLCAVTAVPLLVTARLALQR